MIMCLLIEVDGFQNDEDNRLSFINEFFKRYWIKLHANVCQRTDFWQAVMRVEQPRSEVLQVSGVGGCSLLLCQLTLPSFRRPSAKDGGR